MSDPSTLFAQAERVFSLVVCLPSPRRTPFSKTIHESGIRDHNRPQHANILATTVVIGVCRATEVVGPKGIERNMPGTRNLQAEIGKKQPFEQPSAEAFLNIMRTASLLSGEFEHLFKAHGLTTAMYNAMRILRGAGERGRMCHEIGEQMISRVPDVTRLVDRLEKLGLAQRARCGEDRRVIHVTISAKGLEALAMLDEPVRALHERQMGHMSAADLARLSELLVAARERVGDADSATRSSASPE